MMRPDRHVGDDTDHPSVLPWYVSGRLDPPETSLVEAHLRSCAGCRAEVEALASMRRTYLAYRDNPEVLGGMNDQGRTPPIGVAAPTRFRPAPWAWALVGAAAALLVIVAFPAPWRSALVPHREPILVEAQSIVLLPVLRSPSEEPVLEMPGPWSIQVVLPLGAPAGEYEVRIERDGLGVVRGATSRVRVAAGSQVALLLRSLPGAGRYRVTLEPAQGPGTSKDAGPFAYRFEVAP